MKNIIILLLALIATLVIASPEAGPKTYNPGDWGRGACMKRAPNVQRAIELYCPKPHLGGRFLPGGLTKKVGNAVVSIDAGCDPAQWLPWDVCYKQFYSMCVSGNDRGENTRQYGNNRCQKWKISNPK